MSETATSVVFINHKGGTGKTTSCLSIAGYLAKSGNKVLVVDFDPQANATMGLGIDMIGQRYSIFDALLNQCNGYEGVPITQVILDTDIENLHIAPSELDLSVADVVMHRTTNRVSLLNRALEDVRHFYDFILIDLPPNSGLLTINGLCASDQVIVPLDPSIYSLDVLDNLKISFNEVAKMAGHSIKQPEGILIRYVKPNIFSRILHKHNPSQEVESKLKEMFKKLYVIPYSEKIYEAQKAGVPISHYAPGSRAAKAYAKIARRIINNSINK
jgi:chromosome partitioning protein